MFQKCDNCGYQRDLINPHKTFWRGDSPPDNSYNYCPNCGKPLKTYETDMIDQPKVYKDNDEKGKFVLDEW